MALLVHAGGELVTRELLKTIPVPPATDTWKPIAHFDLVTAVDRQLRVRDFEIVREQYALAHDGLRLFGVIDVRVPGLSNGQPYGFTVGIRTANDRAFATSLIAGARIFVCDNLAFSGDFIAMNRKHTKNFDLNGHISAAVDRYALHLATFNTKLEGLRNRRLEDGEAKTLIFDAFARDIVPLRLFDAVQKTYFSPTDDMEDVKPRTAYGLHNAFTRAVKQLAPASAWTTTAGLGKLFGLNQYTYS